jgi:hypothetical protein
MTATKIAKVVPAKSLGFSCKPISRKIAELITKATYSQKLSKAKRVVGDM